MNKKMSLTLIAIGLGMSLSNIAAAQEKLIVYTSMKESLIGALKAKFTEKYPDVETVYTIGDVSKELCGGPHVKNTSELGKFKIQKEEASSAGVRRIKAILEK